MAYPPYDYIARRDIKVGDSVGYRTGDGMYAQVAQDLGLVLGVDVDAARSDVIERPADSARRLAWVEYALAQDPSLARDDTDDMTRADLIERCTPKPAATAKKSASTKDASTKDSTGDSTKDTGVSD